MIGIILLAVGLALIPTVAVGLTAWTDENTPGYTKRDLRMWLMTMYPISFLIMLAVLCGTAHADEMKHWRLVEQVERGSTLILQTPLNQNYYMNLKECVKDGSSDKYQIPQPTGQLFAEPITHIITCIEYKQGQDSPTRTP